MRFSQLWSKEKCRNVIMSKSNKVENKNGTSVEMLDAFKRQHMIVRNFNALTLSRTFSPSLLFLFSTFSFFGIFMFRHFYFRPKLGLPNMRPFLHPKICPFPNLSTADDQLFSPPRLEDVPSQEHHFYLWHRRQPDPLIFHQCRRQKTSVLFIQFARF